MLFPTLSYISWVSDYSGTLLVVPQKIARAFEIEAVMGGSWKARVERGWSATVVAVTMRLVV